MVDEKWCGIESKEVTLGAEMDGILKKLTVFAVFEIETFGDDSCGISFYFQ